MARDLKKRQKALEHKAAKRKQQKANRPKGALAARATFRSAARWPLHECLITRDWENTPIKFVSVELTLKATRKRIDIAKIGLQQATDVLNSVARRYDAGNASNVDVIDVQTAYTSAKTNFVTAVYDNYIAEVQLARATGNACFRT